MVALATAFRLFFLLAALLAALAIPAWTLVTTQQRSLHSSLGGMGWHAHEMLFGYVGAVLAGFLLTAAKQWTKQQTLGPIGLGAVLALWVAGRVAVLQSGSGAAAITAAADCLFFLVVAVALAIPIYRSRSQRNYAFPILMALLGLCDLCMHLHMWGVAPVWTARAPDFAIDLIVLVILIFGGRIIPLFTKGATEALIREKGILDFIAPWLMAGYAWQHFLLPQSILTHIAAVVVGTITCWRLLGWGGSHTLGKPILWVLHLSWLLVGSGIAMGGLVALTEFAPPGIFLHLLTVGGIGLMTLGMMSRVSLGHTGRGLRVHPLVALAFVVVVLAALARVIAPLVSPLHYASLLWIAAAAWSLGFLLFLAIYAPILLSPRADSKPG